MATSTKSGDQPVKTKPAAATGPKTAKTKPVAAKKPADAKKPAAVKKPAAAKKPAGAKLALEKRRYYVEVAAYYIAERRGFHGGCQLDDWVQAETEIDRLLQAGILKP